MALSLTSRSAARLPLLASRPALRTSKLQCQTPSLRPISSSLIRQSASSEHGHEDHYDTPGGWLWGVPPGQKYQKEGWEDVWIWGFFGSMAVLVVGYVYKPDTSIQTWALEEARRRLEAEGILEDPEAKKS
ncbi:MAG: hypothetical protein M1820_000527 [Bogoriella megaspora]|nr:MAG: hypothetical protein M1820_000527 [Bogoriella megaspora]